MATIQEKIKGGKIVSYKFKVCLGRDENGKQIFRCKTWYPPAELTKAKSKKEAERVAILWETEMKQSFLLEKETSNKPRAKREFTFDQFVNEVWIPLCVRDGSHRPSTAAMYTNILKIILPYFKDDPIQEITSLHLSQYLSWLRTDYRTNRGKPLAEKSIRHHYNILGMIFGYAEKQEVIQKNPMVKVDPPKVSKKDVDALTEDEARRFFFALGNCPLEFRCMMEVLITTGLRRGECLGLQWQDIDFENETISVKRSVLYTPETGIYVSEPKTSNSVRTIPVMKSTLYELQLLLKEGLSQIL